MSTSQYYYAIISDFDESMKEALAGNCFSGPCVLAVIIAVLDAVAQYDFKYMKAEGTEEADLSDADATFQGLSRGVSAAGDQNQDGYEDILVGGNSCNTYYCNSTDIYLFYGAPN